MIRKAVENAKMATISRSSHREITLTSKHCFFFIPFSSHGVITLFLLLFFFITFYIILFITFFINRFLDGR